MIERNGVRVGQRVRDLDGTDLGRVARLFGDGFLVEKGFPVLFRRQAVVRYSEVRGVRDGAVLVARSARDLVELAEGGVPTAWRIPAPASYPAAATPSEAQHVFEDVAAGAISADGAAAGPPPRAPAEPGVGAGDVEERREGHRPSPSPPPGLAP